MVRTETATYGHPTTHDFSFHNVRPVNNAVGVDIRNGTWFQSGRLDVRVFPTNLDYTMTGTLDCHRTKKSYVETSQRAMQGCTSDRARSGSKLTPLWRYTPDPSSQVQVLHHLSTATLFLSLLLLALVQWFCWMACGNKMVQSLSPRTRGEVRWASAACVFCRQLADVTCSLERPWAQAVRMNTNSQWIGTASVDLTHSGYMASGTVNFTRQATH